MYCYDLSKLLTLWAICLSFCELEGLRIVSIEFESSFAKQEICGSIWILIFANSVYIQMIKEITCYTFSFSNRVTSRFYNAKFLNAKPDANVMQTNL